MSLGSAGISSSSEGTLPECEDSFNAFTAHVTQSDDRLESSKSPEELWEDLCKVIEDGSVGQVRDLVRQGVDLSREDDEGFTCLHRLVRKIGPPKTRAQYKKIAKEIVEAIPSWWQLVGKYQSRSPWSFCDTSANGGTEATYFFLTKTTVSVMAVTRENPAARSILYMFLVHLTKALFMYVAIGNSKWIQHLVDQGADLAPRRRHQPGITSFHIAISQVRKEASSKMARRKYYKVIKELITAVPSWWEKTGCWEQVAPPGRRRWELCSSDKEAIFYLLTGKDGNEANIVEPALHMAMRTGAPANIIELLQGPVDGVQRSLSRSLREAVTDGNHQQVARWVGKGADLSETDGEGKSCFHLAIDQIHEDRAATSKYIRIIQALIDQVPTWWAGKCVQIRASNAMNQSATTSDEIESQAHDEVEGPSDVPANGSRSAPAPSSPETQRQVSEMTIGGLDFGIFDPDTVLEELAEDGEQETTMDDSAVDAGRESSPLISRETQPATSNPANPRREESAARTVREDCPAVPSCSAQMAKRALLISPTPNVSSPLWYAAAQGVLPVVDLLIHLKGIFCFPYKEDLDRFDVTDFIPPTSTCDSPNKTEYLIPQYAMPAGTVANSLTSSQPNSPQSGSHGDSPQSGSHGAHNLCPRNTNGLEIDIPRCKTLVEVILEPGHTGREDLLKIPLLRKLVKEYCGVNTWLSRIPFILHTVFMFLFSWYSVDMHLFYRSADDPTCNGTLGPRATEYPYTCGELPGFIPYLFLLIWPVCMLGFEVVLIKYRRLTAPTVMFMRLLWFFLTFLSTILYLTNANGKDYILVVAIMTGWTFALQCSNSLDGYVDSLRVKGLVRSIFWYLLLLLYGISGYAFALYLLFQRNAPEFEDEGGDDRGVLDWFVLPFKWLIAADAPSFESNSHLSKGKRAFVILLYIILCLIFTIWLLNMLIAALVNESDRAAKKGKILKLRSKARHVVTFDRYFVPCVRPYLKAFQKRYVGLEVSEDELVPEGTAACKRCYFKFKTAKEAYPTGLQKNVGGVGDDVQALRHELVTLRAEIMTEIKGLAVELKNIQKALPSTEALHRVISQNTPANLNQTTSVVGLTP